MMITYQTSLLGILVTKSKSNIYIYQSFIKSIKHLNIWLLMQVCIKVIKVKIIKTKEDSYSIQKSHNNNFIRLKGKVPNRRVIIKPLM